jgi:hypothetical protein
VLPPDKFSVQHVVDTLASHTIPHRISVREPSILSVLLSSFLDADSSPLERHLAGKEPAACSAGFRVARPQIERALTVAAEAGTHLEAEIAAKKGCTSDVSMEFHRRECHKASTYSNTVCSSSNMCST